MEWRGAQQLQALTGWHLHRDVNYVLPVKLRNPNYRNSYVDIYVTQGPQQDPVTVRQRNPDRVIVLERRPVAASSAFTTTQV
jgi:hypothetical protein